MNNKENPVKYDLKNAIEYSSDFTDFITTETRINKKIAEMKNEIDRFIFDSLKTDYNYVVEKRTDITKGNEGCKYRMFLTLEYTKPEVFDVKYDLNVIRQSLADKNIDYMHISFEETIELLKKRCWEERKIKNYNIIFGSKLQFEKGEI